MWSLWLVKLVKGSDTSKVTELGVNNESPHPFSLYFTIILWYVMPSLSLHKILGDLYHWNRPQRLLDPPGWQKFKIFDENIRWKMCKYVLQVLLCAWFLINHASNKNANQVAILNYHRVQNVSSSDAPTTTTSSWNYSCDQGCGKIEIIWLIVFKVCMNRYNSDSIYWVHLISKMWL